jgi:hypothetical protein
MADDKGQRIRVVLKWVQILDNLEPIFKERGEFRFNIRVASENRGGIVEETSLPRRKKYYSISDNPAWNKKLLDEVVFEGEIDDHLEIAIEGEELDYLSPNDQLDPYRRTFIGDPSSWIGEYYPGDEGANDPEKLSNWRICYEIQRA